VLQVQLLLVQVVLAGRVALQHVHQLQHDTAQHVPGKDHAFMEQRCGQHHHQSHCRCLLRVPQLGTWTGAHLSHLACCCASSCHCVDTHQCQDLLHALPVLPVHDHELPLKVVQLLLSSSHCCSHALLYTDQAVALQQGKQAG
jgi:hypothetical protein